MCAYLMNRKSHAQVQRSIHDIGVEFHYLFVCDHFISDWNKFLSLYFYKSPNIINFKELIFFSKYQEACKVIKFCRNYYE